MLLFTADTPLTISRESLAECVEIAKQAEHTGPRALHARALRGITEAESTSFADLGLVDYIFSDKTGTLTSNEMQLRLLAIKHGSFGAVDFK